MITDLVEKLGKGKTLHACWDGIRDPQLAAAIAAQPFDVIVLDAQHGFHDEASIIDCIPPVVMAGKSPLVRIPLNRWDLVQRVLDFGALGSIAPMINTADDARAFVDAAKFPQMGSRSFGPRYAASMHGLSVEDYVTKANGATLALAQIETREAYENLDDILGVEGLDGILMGPSDFSIFMTGNQLPDAYGPDTVDAVKDTAERTRAAGKIAAAFTLTSAHAKLVKGFGYQLISVAMDS
ncbi:MAG: aldolase/citrate lyase family protein, partial [Pseudomonadota bacterium]